MAAVVPSLPTSTTNILTVPDELHVAAPTRNVVVCQCRSTEA